MIPSADQCKTEFERVSRLRPLSEPMHVGHLRWEALDRFLSLGFPTTDDEGWAFTDVAPIADQLFTVGAPPAAARDYVNSAPSQLPGVFGTELLFVNGYYLPDASITAALPPGVRVEPLSAVLHAHAEEIAAYLARVAPFEWLAFIALNTALFMDGACIRIPANTVVAEPIHVRFISTGDADMRPAMTHPRVLVVMDQGSDATIVESFVGPDGIEYLTNAVTEIVLGDRAHLDHCKVQHDGFGAYHVNATHVAAADHADYSLYAVSIGGRWVRNDVVASLDGEHARCVVNTLSAAHRERLIDNHTWIDHAPVGAFAGGSLNGVRFEPLRHYLQDIVRRHLERT